MNRTKPEARKRSDYIAGGWIRYLAVRSIQQVISEAYSVPAPKTRCPSYGDTVVIDAYVTKETVEVISVERGWGCESDEITSVDVARLRLRTLHAVIKDRHACLRWRDAAQLPRHGDDQRITGRHGNVTE